MLKELPSNILSLSEQPISYGEIHHRFSQTSAGIRLAGNIRFGPHKPEHITNEKWISILGYDAHNLEHCRLMYGLTRHFIRYQNESNSKIKFNKKEQQILLLTALTHDWPEGITAKGDVNFENKTIKDEKAELSVIKTAITDILGNNPINQKLAKQVKYCLKNKNSKLGRAFNIIESIGYIRTSLIVWEKSNNSSDTILSSNLKKITNNVLLNSLPVIIDHSSDYPFINKFLHSRSQVISDAFSMDKSVFDSYSNKDKIPDYIFRFNSANTKWHQWNTHTA